jgi:structural maintenance of chromosome 2
LTEKEVQHEKCVSIVSELEKTAKTYGNEQEGRLTISELEKMCVYSFGFRVKGFRFRV